MLPKIYRVRKNSEFKTIYQDSRSLAAKNVVLFVRQREDSQLKIGFSVSKKIGKAYKRNHVKRRMRHIAQENLANIKMGYELVFLARTPIKEASYQQIRKDMVYLLKKSGIWHEKMATENPVGDN